MKPKGNQQLACLRICTSAVSHPDAKLPKKNNKKQTNKYFGLNLSDWIMAKILHEDKIVK